jgi:hypothetical protein
VFSPAAQVVIHSGEKVKPVVRRVIPGILYFPISAVAVLSAAAVVAATTGNKWYLGYAVYGSVAIFFILLPNSLAYWLNIDVPFPTFFRTLGHLERREAFLAKYLRLAVGLIRPPTRL